MREAGRILALVLLFGALVLTACGPAPALPVLGERVIDARTGRATDYRAPDFRLTTHRGATLSEADLAGRVHVVDFFFTACPTICPTMTRHLRLVQAAFTDGVGPSILSHTIDPRRDTPERLRDYAGKNAIESADWHLLTGEQQDIFDLSRGYKVQAYGGDNSGNDIFHDGTFVLLDGQRRIRGYYDGLNGADVERLINDIKTLLHE